MRLSLAIAISALLFSSYVVTMPVDKGKRKASELDSDTQPPGASPYDDSGRRKRLRGDEAIDPQSPMNPYFRPQGPSFGLPSASHQAGQPNPQPQGSGSVPHDPFFPSHSDLHDPFGLGPGSDAHNAQLLHLVDQHLLSHPQIPSTTEPFHFGPGFAAHNPPPGPSLFGPDLAAPHNPHAAIPELQHPPVQPIVHPSLLDAAAGRSSAATGRSRGATGRRSRGAAGRSSAATGPSNAAAGPSNAAADCSRTYRYNCEAHNFRTDTAKDFRRHQEKTLLHGGGKPHACPDCDKTFTRQDHLGRHQRKHGRQ